MVIYICDRCKKQFENSREKKIITMDMGPFHFPRRWEYMLCESCFNQVCDFCKGLKSKEENKND